MTFWMLVYVWLFGMPTNPVLEGHAWTAKLLELSKARLDLFAWLFVAIAIIVAFSVIGVVLRTSYKKGKYDQYVIGVLTAYSGFFTVTAGFYFLKAMVVGNMLVNFSPATGPLNPGFWFGALAAILLP